MESNETKRVQRSLTKVLKTSDIDSGQEKKLRKAQRDFDKIVNSGKLDKARIIRVVDTLATLLLEIRNDEDTDE